MIRAAIVGLGTWGRTLVEAAEGLEDEFAFVAACTRSPRNASDFCDAYSLRLLPSFDAVLADDTVDAVVIATPHSLHADQFEGAARAGKHVFVEKPFALDIQSARRAADAAREAGIVWGVAYPRRFHPAMIEVASRLESGELGTLVGIVGQQSNMMAPFLGEHWRVAAGESPAGAMTAISVHTIDAMIQLGGPILEVHCDVQSRAASVDDTTCLMLRFKRGGVGQIFSSMSTARFARLSVYGSKGMAEIAGPRLEHLEVLAAPTESPTGPAAPMEPERINYPQFNMYGKQLAIFAACISKGLSFPVPPEQILHGVAVMEAAIKSAAVKQPVSVEPAG